VCRFDFHNLANFNKAISAPKESLMARKQILVTALGRNALAEE
jgi:hypothetical protein